MGNLLNHKIPLLSRSQTHLILEYGLAIPRDTAKLAGAWARNITMGEGATATHQKNRTL